MEGHLLSCTFCKRNEKQVEKLVSGPGVYICDRCTDQAHAIIHDDAGATLAPSLWKRLVERLRRSSQTGTVGRLRVTRQAF